MSDPLNRFFQDAFIADQKAKEANSFNAISDLEMANLMEIDQYDSFVLTDAVRPSADLKIKPTQGYRHDVYIDEDSNLEVPVIMAAASKSKLFPLFIQLIEKLGPVVDVVLESSHANTDLGHTDLYREHIDMPVLISILYQYEDLLMNDGCTGIAVLNPNTPQEVQFEEHKLLIVYGSPLEPYEFAFESAGVRERTNMQFITEAEHVHCSTEKYAQRFNELRTDLGLDGNQRPQSFNEDKYEGESYGGDFYNEENYGGEFDGDCQGGLL
jgi:hypothetical protein